MDNKTIIAVVITLIIAGGGGYMIGKNSTDPGAATKEIQDSIVMMKKQSASIQQMSDLMQSSGRTLQELGAKYQDAMMVSNGKDLEAVGEKYLREDTEAARSNGSMKQMMGN